MITVIVTGVSATSVGGQIVKCLQSKKKNYTTIACNSNIDAVHEVDADHHEFLPLAGHLSYMDTLTGLVTRYGVQYIVPGTEAELQFLLRNWDAKSGSNCEILANSREIVESCLDKSAFVTMMNRIGFPVPQEIEVEINEGVTNNNEKNSVDYPIILKPRLSSGGSKDVYIAQDDEDLKYYSSYFARNKIACTAQQYVGSWENEYTIGIVSNDNEDVLSCSIMHRDLNHPLSIKSKIKNRTGRGELGEWLCVSSGISQGVFVDDVIIRNQAIAIAKAICSKGPLNIQARFLQGKLVPFEINPRFSGTSYFRSLAGVNEVDLLINNKTNSIAEIHYPIAGKCRRLLTELFLPGYSV